jgi:hypothetical protein
MKTLTWAIVVMGAVVWFACSVALDLDQYEFPQAALEPDGSDLLTIMPTDDAPDDPTPTPSALWDSPSTLWDSALWN